MTYLCIVNSIHLSDMSNWSSGMIPPSGGGGPGFDSRIGPMSFCFASWLTT